MAIFVILTSQATAFVINNPESWSTKITSDTNILWHIDSITYNGDQYVMTVKLNNTLFNLTKGTNGKQLPLQAAFTQNIKNVYGYKNTNEFLADMTMNITDLDNVSAKHTARDVWQDFNETTGTIDYVIPFPRMQQYEEYEYTYNCTDPDNCIQSGWEIVTKNKERTEIRTKFGSHSIYVTSTLGTDLKIIQNQTSNDTKYIASIDVSEGKMFSSADNSSFDLQNGLVLDMDFNDYNTTHSNTTVYDFSGNMNHGTLTNMNLGIDNGTSGWTSSGKFGNGMQCDGSNDKVITATSNALNITNAFSMSLWAKKVSQKNYQMYITKANASNITEFQLMDSGTTGKVEFRFGNDNAGLISTSVVGTNVWAYIVVVYNSTNQTIYINGTQDAIRGWTTNSIPQTTALEICTRNNAFNFQGTIDSVKIYNRALSAAEINASYNAGLADHTSNITILSNSAVTYDTISNTNSSYIVHIPEVNRTFSFTPTYIRENATLPTNTTILNTTDLSWLDKQTITATSAWQSEQNITKIRVTFPTAISQYDLFELNLTQLIGYDPANIQNVWYNSYTGVTSNSTLKATSDYVSWVDTCNSGNTTGLVGCWNFNEGQGTIAKDRANNSQNNNDGTLTNMNAGINNGTSGWTSNGKFGNGINFDGVGAFVVSNSVPFDTTKSTTFTAWVNRGILNGESTRFAKCNNFYFMIGNVGTTWTSSPPNWGGANCGNTYALGWHYYSWTTINSSSTFNITIYVDGVYCTNTELAYGTNAGTGCNIGQSDTIGYFNGTIDEVRIFNRALSAAEIAAEYNLKKDYFNAMVNQEGTQIAASTNWDLYIQNGTVSTTPPTITIQQPTNATINKNWFNATATDTNSISLCWYNQGGANQTLTNLSGNWNYQNTTLSDGTYTAKFYCNDSLGNENTTQIVFTYDGTPPMVTILKPTNATINTNWFNATASDAKGISSCWYNQGNGNANQTLTNSSGNWNYRNTTLTDGYYISKFYCNDSTGNVNVSQIGFTYDITPPAITILTPSAGNTSRNWFNITASDLHNVSSCWYSENSTTANKTLTNSSGNWNYQNSSMINGDYVTLFFCNDTVNNVQMSSRTSTYDNVSPILTFQGATSQNSTQINETDRVDINVTFTELHEDTCFVDWNSQNYTMTMDKTANTCTYTFGNVVDGDYNYYVWLNDSAGNSNISETRTVIMNYAAWRKQYTATNMLGGGGDAGAVVTSTITTITNITSAATGFVVNVTNTMTDWDAFVMWLTQYANSPVIEIPRCKDNATIVTMSALADGTQAEIVECTEHEAIPGIVILGAIGFIVSIGIFHSFKWAFNKLV